MLMLPDGGKAVDGHSVFGYEDFVAFVVQVFAPVVEERVVEVAAINILFGIEVGRVAVV